jgi:adenosylhomocysteinase
VTHDIKNPSLADQGRARIEWAFNEMPVLRRLLDQLGAQRPLAGIRIGGCLHITTETANLARVLTAAGADLALCASNPLSTQDDVAAALVTHYGVPTYAIRGESSETYYQHINQVLDHRPQVTLDDGADLVSTLHRQRGELLDEVIGGTEETTTGVIRLRAMAADGALRYPVMAVNDAMTKHLFDNRYGTGQSIAMRAKGHGANVVVTEVEPLRALEAAMDGYRVMPLTEAAAISDFIVTATGDKHVVDAPHLAVMKDGCILANSGHFNVEINIPALEALAADRQRVREHVDEYRLKDGRVLRLLAQGRLVNLAAAEGHPSTVMDMSFANQVLCVQHLVAHRGTLENAVHPVPVEIDQTVAREKLAAMGIHIDTLTDAQAAYLRSWREGT